MSEHMRARLQMVRNRGPVQELLEIIEIMEDLIMAVDAIGELQTQFDDYKNEVATAFAALDTALGNFAAKVNDLANDIAAGAAVDPAKVAALQADIAAAKQVATDEAAKATAADPGAIAKSVYVVDAGAPVDTTQWIPTGTQTDETPPRPLYTYVGDTAPGDEKGEGAGGIWHLWTGASQPIPPPPAPAA